MNYLFKLGSSLVPEKVTTAETVTDGEWEIGYEAEADADERLVVFRPWMTRLGTWMGRRSSSPVTPFPLAGKRKHRKSKQETGKSRPAGSFDSRTEF